MFDPFDNHAQSLENPTSLLVAITPNDGTDLTMTARALNVTHSGILQVTTTGSSTATLYILPTAWAFRFATRLWDTGTTATVITAAPVGGRRLACRRGPDGVRRHTLCGGSGAKRADRRGLSRPLNRAHRANRAARR